MKITPTNFENYRSLISIAEEIPKEQWRYMESGYSSKNPGHCAYLLYYFAKHTERGCWLVKACGINDADPCTFDADDIDFDNFSVVAMCHDVPEEDPEAICDLIYEELWEEGLGFD